MNKIIGIIPARHKSTRFPGKPLAGIRGKPMIQWTYENARKSISLDEVYVATDDLRIADVVRGFGGNVIMTSVDHQSGTDRCMEAVTKLDFTPDIIVNIQGDEPLIKAKMIDQLCDVIRPREVRLATLVQVIEDENALFDPNRVKVVLDKSGKALLFSRSTIPHNNKFPKHEWVTKHVYYKHVGIYAYRLEALKEITRLPPSKLEQMESLEQLRWLENGFDIHTGITAEVSPSVDTPEDLAKIIEIIDAAH